MNRLQNETSPYLLQHADNPVDWHPWDTEALALAKKEDKPILLSIGFSANHMCQVMAHESFENQKVASFMNEHFVNIKVDREERPDLDRIYQGAQQLLNRQPGGWPLTMILEPDEQLPIIGGTYFPPQQTRDQPSFRDILSGVSKTYDSKNDKLKEFKIKMREALAPKPVESFSGKFDATMLDRACGQIDSSFDPEFGGFSAEPKSPHPAGLELMLDVASASDEKIKIDRLHDLLDTTLTAMSRGGLFDHLGGGFFGYSVDREWTIPRFEKMLYDNGLLLSVYAQRAHESGNNWYKDVANQTADWMIREMQLDSGGICSNLNAVSEDEEGRFYTWKFDDVRSIVGDDYDEFAKHYDLEKNANFGTLWHLRLDGPSAPKGDEESARASNLIAARRALLESREQRIRPSRDEKVITAWNALSVKGLANVGGLFARPDCVDAAQRAVDYLAQTHWQDGRLFTSSRDGAASLNGYLDDYAFLVDALVNLLATRWRDSDLQFAIDVANAMLENFEDTANGGFFFTSNDHENLVQRTKPLADESLPSGNGVAVQALIALGSLTGESRYLDAAARALRSSMTQIDRWPSAHGTLLRGMLDHMNPVRRVIVRGNDMDEAMTWRVAALEQLNPRDRCYVVPANNGLLDSIRSANVQSASTTTAYVCCGVEVSEPLDSLNDLKKHLTV